MFGALLRRYRVDAGLTQAALAERAGLSVRAVQHLEAGRGQPYQDTARRLADALPLDRAAREALHAASEPTPRRRNRRGTAVDLMLLYDRSEAENLKGVAEALQNDHGIHVLQATWGSVAAEHPQGLRGARAGAVFIGARGLGDWSSGALASALGRAVRDGEQSLIAVLLPGAPEPFDATTPPPPLNTRPWLDLRSGVEIAFAAQQLARTLRGSQDSLDAPRALGTAECPYRGLEAFDEEHADLFFGREAAIQRLLEQLKSSRFVAVVAPPGRGQAPPGRAGVLPPVPPSAGGGGPPRGGGQVPSGAGAGERARQRGVAVARTWQLPAHGGSHGARLAGAAPVGVAGTCAAGSILTPRMRRRSVRRSLHPLLRRTRAQPVHRQPA